MAARTQFYLDKQNRKWAGVCAGIADYTGVDATVVRVALVLLTVLSTGWLILGYIAAAVFAPTKPSDLYQSPSDAKFWQGVRANPTRSATEVRSRFRELDRRLADMELHYTSRNQRLADEIDSLR